MTITPSHILEYLFCPRFTYFEYVLCIPQYQEKYFKVQKGRDVHETKARQNTDYMRAKLGVTDKLINRYLTSDTLRGEPDEILFFAQNLAAPLDYKYAEFKDVIYNTYKTQLYCYAILIEANFKVSVDKGFIVYTRSKNKLIEVLITDEDKQNVKNTISEIIEIIDTNNYPKATPDKKKCVTCTYANICIK